MMYNWSVLGSIAYMSAYENLKVSPTFVDRSAWSIKECLEQF